MAAFILGVFVGFFFGWLVCALMVHAGRESDSMDAEARGLPRPTVFPKCGALYWPDQLATAAGICVLVPGHRGPLHSDGWTSGRVAPVPDDGTAARED